MWRALRAGKPPRSDDKLIAALAAMLDDAQAGAGFRRAGAGAAGRRRHRARDRPRHRSRRDLPRPHGACARRSASGSAPRLSTPTSAWRSPAPTRPTPPAPAGARCAMSRSICWRRPARPSAIARAARQYDARRQHDRPHGGARARCRCTPCRSASARLPISTRAMPPMRWSSTNGSRCRP